MRWNAPESLTSSKEGTSRPRKLSPTLKPCVTLWNMTTTFQTVQCYPSMECPMVIHAVYTKLTPYPTRSFLSWVWSTLYGAVGAAWNTELTMQIPCNSLQIEMHVFAGLATCPWTWERPPSKTALKFARTESTRSTRWQRATWTWQSYRKPFPREKTGMWRPSKLL